MNLMSNKIRSTFRAKNKIRKAKSEQMNFWHGADARAGVTTVDGSSEQNAGGDSKTRWRGGINDVFGAIRAGLWHVDVGSKHGMS